MNLYEYQAKEVFARQQIPIPKGYIASEERHINEAYEKIGDNLGVIKAQVLTGGRGKAGGIKAIDSFEQAQDTFRTLMGMKIKGLTVERSAMSTRQRKVAAKPGS